MYCGKKQHSSDVAVLDTNPGPASVVRNLVQAFGEHRAPYIRLVIVDRIYNSSPLAMQLLHMSY